MKPTIVLFTLLTLFLPCSYAQMGKDSLITALQQARSDTERITLNLLLSEKLQDKQLRESLNYALAAIDLSAHARGNYKRRQAFSRAGTVCFYAGLFDRAVDYFSSALTLAEASNDLLQRGDAYLNLGGVHYILGNYANSKKYTELGYQTIQRHFLAQHSPLPADAQLAYYNNIALASMKQGNAAEAKGYFLKAINLAKSSGDHLAFSRPMTGLADLLLSIGRLDSARQVLTDLIPHEQAYGYISGLTVTYALLGELSLKESKTDQALGFFMTAFTLAEGRKDDFTQERVSKNLAQVYQSKGMSDSALKYLNIHQAFLGASEKTKAKQVLLQKELDRLLEEKEQSGKRQRLLERTLLGTTAALSLAGLLFFVFRYRQRSKFERMEAALREEKFGLDKQVLQDALNLKDKQLATQVMYALQKNEMVSELIARLKATVPMSTEGKKSILGKYLRDIEDGQPDPWQEFEQRFQAVHAGFYERLMEKYPELTPNERRLCAFLRLDMTTKEISNLTGQRVKAITQARFRLRAKMGIEEPETSLFELLLHL